MHYSEAEWIASKLSHLEQAEISRVLNVGSSTKHFRCIQQPFINDLIFLPMIERSIEVVHLDAKQMDGVDIVGDITDDDFIKSLQHGNYKAIICSNLLEHVDDRNVVIRALKSIVDKGGYIIVTGPSEYPKHMDPIDNMYRPTLDDLIEEFDEFELIDAKLLNVGDVWSSISKEPYGLIKLIIGLFLPFYRYPNWVTAVNKLLWMFRDRKIACVFLKKSDIVLSHDGVVAEDS